jgi:hypothetical protein
MVSFSIPCKYKIGFKKLREKHSLAYFAGTSAMKTTEVRFFFIMLIFLPNKLVSLSLAIFFCLV